MAETKNDQSKMGANQNKGSGSDTVSAAKISAGTSVGNVGEAPMPHAQAGSATGAQSSTLASHTSKPMGGTSSTGAGSQASSGASATGGAASQAGSSQGGTSQGGMADSAKKAAADVQERVGDAYEQATEWARDTYESASSWASDSTGSYASRRSGRSSGRMGNARQGVQTYVAQNPVMVGLVGLAAGLLLGALLPRTRKEDETFGEWADEVREQGLRYAHEMAQRGRDYVEQSFSGEDDRFSRHQSEFGGASSGPTGQGPGATSSGQGANRH
ncbi:MAG TPA: hypothetical protein VGU45_10970 [Microvirga sp.]|jgi:ElaB/YqjD/DUF883 family membrane-anchored ribosome-binding protein|nr:hypothetical protein [Microvirga sp.]